MKENPPEFVRKENHTYKFIGQGSIDAETHFLYRRQPDISEKPIDIFLNTSALERLINPE